MKYFGKILGWMGTVGVLAVALLWTTPKCLAIPDVQTILRVDGLAGSATTATPAPTAPIGAQRRTNTSMMPLIMRI